MKKKRMRLIQSMMPALVTGAVILGCAKGPTLQEIPARLELPPMETQSAQTTAEPSPSHKAATAYTPEKSEPVVPLIQGTGTYKDGIYTGTGTGYGGQISVQVTVENGQIVGIEILSAAGETSSFFSRASALLDTIIAAQTWEVDGVSGATYSSNGIKAAVQNALTGESVATDTPNVPTGNAKALVEVSFSEPVNGYADGAYTGSAQGFGGLISVQLTIEGGAITDISVLSCAGETSSYFSRTQTVISSILFAQSPNVDGVSGATYSSMGIINAVKAALAQAVQASTPEPSPAPSEVPVERPNFGYPDGVYTGTGGGFGGNITVSVTVEGGQITALEILSAEEETPEFLARAKGVLELVMEHQNTEVDAVAGATFSSEGILKAIAQALDTACVPEPSGPEPSPTPTPSAMPTQAPDEPVVETLTETYTGAGSVAPDAYEDFLPYTFTLELTVTVTKTTTVQHGLRHIVTERAITDCRVLSTDTDKTNQRYLTKALSGMMDGLLAGKVDAITGATCSSAGIQAAWDSALSGVSLEKTEEVISPEEGEG